MKVHIDTCDSYDQDAVDSIAARWAAMFDDNVRKGDRVVLKPNWLAHCHKYDPDEWLSVITHPAVITAVLRCVLERLGGAGRVTITDGPQTDSDFDRIMDRMTPDLWRRMGRAAGVEVEVVDLREDAWITKGDVNVARRKLEGDPRGSTVCDLGDNSEFVKHSPSPRGYYGADYDKAETNEAHSAGRHKYRASRTVIEADLFINVPKLKTHKKAGITCSLKNLVGINTYKNWLPHHNEGAPDEGGDQFPGGSKSRVESKLNERFKAVLTKHPALGRWMVPVKAVGKKVFGETKDTIRNGNWYGNDTIWRTVLDLNKMLLYANPDGSLRPDDFANAKRYMSVVDGIIAGDGNGPEAPTPKHAHTLICGTNPVAVDMACARVMGFDWRKIPSLRGAFEVERYALIDCAPAAIVAVADRSAFHGPLLEIDPADTFGFRPHFGWTGHIELEPSEPVAV